MYKNKGYKQMNKNDFSSRQYYLYHFYKTIPYTYTYSPNSENGLEIKLVHPILKNNNFYWRFMFKMDNPGIGNRCFTVSTSVKSKFKKERIKSQ